MEATFTLLRENAPFAVITLLAVLYLDSNMDEELGGIRNDMNQQTREIRGDIAGLSERVARVETKIDGLENRMSGLEHGMTRMESSMERLSNEVLD